METMKMMYELKKEFGISPTDYDSLDEYIAAAMTLMQNAIEEKNKGVV